METNVFCAENLSKDRRHTERRAYSPSCKQGRLSSFRKMTLWSDNGGKFIHIQRAPLFLVHVREAVKSKLSAPTLSRLPFPLLCVGFSIGVWCRETESTWQATWLGCCRAVIGSHGTILVNGICKIL